MCVCCHILLKTEFVKIGAMKEYLVILQDEVLLNKINRLLKIKPGEVFAFFKMITCCKFRSFIYIYTNE